MKHRGPILLAVVLVAMLVAAAVALVLVRGNGSDSSTSSAPWDPVPVADEPTAASPAEQTAFEQELIQSLTQDDLLDAQPTQVTPPRHVDEGSETDQPPPGGETLSVAPSVPTGNRPSRAAGSARCLRNPSQVPARSGYEYVRSCIKAGYDSLPVEAVGVLYQIGPFGASEHCTASVAGTELGGSPGNGSVLVTAGHCLGQRSGGRWKPYRNLLWVPAIAHRILYAQKLSQKEMDAWAERWVWFPKLTKGGNPQAFVPARYQETEDFRYDFAAVVMNRHGSTTIAEDRGGLAIEMNGKAADQAVRSYGNPGMYQFRADQLFVCAGRSKRGDPYLYKDAELEVVGIGCDMTGGSSGGPWLAFTSSAGEKVVSFNSYGFVRCARNPAEAKRYKKQGYAVDLCSSKDCLESDVCAPESDDNLMFGPILDGRHWKSFQRARLYATG